MCAKVTKIGNGLGQRIRDLRRTLFFSQEELAERAKISVSFLSMIERSTRLPHVKTLAAIANAMGVTLSQLFLGIDESGDRPQPEVSLIAYLETLNLDEKDVEVLLLVARSLFEEQK
jgi:transcriptional regulator with XRE-family HTH domain